MVLPISKGEQVKVSSLQIAQIKKSKNLTHELAESLRKQITSGAFKRGEKIPSSKDIETQANVSRSVVREAMAQLRAEGLIESRQGVGVFVTQNAATPRAFEITSEEFKSFNDAIQILQLRMAVEVEMTGMAAQHRTQEQMDNINKALLKMETTIKSKQNAVEEDVMLHQAIAEASGNPYFLRFTQYIDSAMHPNRDIVTKDMSKKEKEEFLNVIKDDHRQIAKAIQMQNVELAKATAKSHVMTSIKLHELVALKLK